MNADVGEELQRIHLSAVGFRSESGTLTQSSSLDNLDPQPSHTSYLICSASQQILSIFALH
eukprot:scaffold1477_cov188-Alexandrium_tamarense.AAC.23